MALTFTQNSKVVIVRGSALGGVQIKSVKITGDAAYAAGGYAITAANLGFSNGIVTVIPCGAMGSTGAAGTQLVPQWDSANSKIKLMKTIASGADVEAAAGDPSGLFLDVVALGY